MSSTEAPFVLEVIFVFLLTLYLLHQYGNWRKQHVLVTIAVFIAWYFSFLIVFVVPLDVSATFYRQCLRDHSNKEIILPTSFPSSNSPLLVSANNATSKTSTKPTPTVPTTVNITTQRSSTAKPGSGEISSVCEKPWSYLPPFVLPDLWRVVYWSSQLLSWIILPIMQSYSYAGEFTVKGKIKTALYENCLWYGSYLIIFGILLIYVILKPGLQVNSQQLQIILITASNTWGLLLLVLLMGYGLVEIPRTAWNYARLEYKLAHAYFKISKLSVEKEESEEQLADTLEAVRKASENIRYRDPLRKYINVIITKCPEPAQYMFNKGTDDYVDYDDYLRETGGKSIETYTEKTLVRLHKKVIVVTQTAHRTQCQWSAQLDNVFELEDVAKSAGSSSRRFKSSFRKPSSGCLGSVNPVLEWYWKIWLYPTLLRVLAVLLLLLTAALIWSEVTFFTQKPNLSLFALLIETASKDYYYFYTELISFITIAYMCSCTYYTVFKMRFFNYYYLSPNHQTDPNSLLFSGLLLCRLTYALCLNFLALIHLDGHVTGAKDPEDTSFTNFMGHMDVLSFISNGFNLYYPMTVVLVCLATFFSLGTRCLNCLGFQTFIIEDDLSIEYINEGKDIVRRERRKRETLNGDGRKETWSERAESAKRRLNERSRRSERTTRSDRDRDGQLNKEQATSQTNLTDSDIRYIKYSKLDAENDRVELLAAADYDPEPLARTGYAAGFGRSSSSRPPQNIFDDI